MGQRRLAAIMFSDIVGYTALMRENEEDGFHSLKRYRQILEQRVDLHQGEILHHYGDGSMSVFSSAVEAIKCAIEIQQSLRQAPVLDLRIGIHVGEVAVEGEYVYGDGINIASRVESMAQPGSVLITERVMQEVKNHPEFKFSRLGKFAFKNVKEKMEVSALKASGLVVPKKEDLNSAKAKPVKEPPSAFSRFVLPALLSLLIVTLFFWGLNAYLSGNSQPEFSDRPIDERSIAVLPFRDLSPNGDQEYFSEGIAEEILLGLSQIEDLKVMGRTSSFSFKNKSNDLSEVGRQLGVAHVLEGSVRKDSNRVRVVAQLVSTEDGYQLWTQRFDREVDDIFSIQEEIARAVADKLTTLLLKENEPQPQVVKISTSNQEAYEWYLRGQHMLSQRTKGAEKAADYFRKAIEIDPGFTAAYAGMGRAYLWLAWGYYLPSHEAFPNALLYAEKALQLDSNLAYGHTLKGSVHLWYEWEWEQAKKSLEKAIQLNPKETEALLELGWYYTIVGEFDTAFVYVEKAVSADPLNLEYNVDLADMLRMAQRYDQALETARSMTSLYPDNSDTHWMMGLVHFTMGEYAPAERYFQEAVQLSGKDGWALIHLALAQTKTAPDKAAALLQGLTENQDFVATVPVEIAMVYLNLGDKNSALDLLEKAYEINANWLVSIRSDPVWDELRGDNRFKSLVRKMAFPKE